MGEEHPWVQLRYEALSVQNSQNIRLIGDLKILDSMPSAPSNRPAA